VNFIIENNRHIARITILLTTILRVASKEINLTQTIINVSRNTLKVAL